MGELESPDQVDYLEVTDGDGTLLGHFGAAHYVDNSEGRRRKGIKISDLTSVTEVVHVLFHTDDSVTRSGWRLEWSSAPSEAEQPTSGVLTSPNYPERYPNGLNLVQKIQVPEGNPIWIRFTDFDFYTDGSVTQRGWRLEWGMVDDESLPKSGVLTSPNYPERYPNSHDSTQTIQ